MPQYLVLLNEPKDGLPWDYNQIRVFTRNRAKHRYETAYRERNMEGYLPVKRRSPEFRQGRRPADLHHPQDERHRPDCRRDYKMNGPIVRRVLSPEEAAAEKAEARRRLGRAYARTSCRAAPSIPRRRLPKSTRNISSFEPSIDSAM